MDNFANVGKAVLLQALGLQKNYSETLEETIEVVDYSNTACRECKHCAIIDNFSPGSEAYEAATNACSNCPHKTFTTKNITKKIYHNEKNKYGYKPRLKSNAIKLLILIHFYHPDRFGIIKNLEIDALSDDLSCDVKTVKNNLDILAQYGYISYCKISPHYINLYLCDYERYYLPASKGGRGFIVLSKELLSEIISLDKLLTLRIHLRELIEIDNLNAKGAFTAISKTYKDIKRSLPDYCKPCIIRQAMSFNSNIFNISFKEKENSVRFEIKDEFNCRMQKDKCLNQYISMFKDFMTEFNKTVTYININNDNPGKYVEFFYESSIPVSHTSSINHMEQNTLNQIRNTGEFKLISIKDFELEDLAQLALQYSFDYVITAFSSIYKSYILKDRKILNLGGLIRTALTALLDKNLPDSLAA